MKSPLRVAVDSREQAPFAFAGLETPDGRLVETIAASLPTADYLLAEHGKTNRPHADENKTRKG